MSKEGNIRNRKRVETAILEFVNEVDTSGYNKSKYIEIFKQMSDSTFDEWMQGMRSGTKFIVIFKPMYKAKITVENNFKLAKKYGLEFLEKLVFSGNPDEVEHMTDVEYLVIDMPYRRQSQTLEKKISLPDDNRIVDELTYQPTGSSRGAKISYPELQVLIGMKMDASIAELIRFRGGDRGGFNAYNAMFLRYGSANLKTLSSYSTGVESTKTVKAVLAAMHVNLAV